MKHLVLILLLTVSISSSAHAQVQPYHLVKTFHIAGGGGWDYLAVNGSNLFVSHGDHVDILNKNTGDSVGTILHTPGVHGIAFVPELNRGYITNGQSNAVTVFSLLTYEVIAQIPVGTKPDAILYDSFSDQIVVCDGGSNDLSLIDPRLNVLKGTIPVGGRPETAVTNDKGRLFVDLEDKNSIAAVDMAKDSVISQWSLGLGTGPTGLAFDKSSQRLFAGCEGHLVILDAAEGSIVQDIAIGQGCDGVMFYAKEGLIFSFNGEGTLSVVKQTSRNQYHLEYSTPTARGARTLALDTTTGIIYLPTASFGKPVSGQRPSIVPGTFKILVVSL